MPPVLGPSSLSNTGLWSWVAGKGTMARPPTSANRLSSCPCRRFSTTTCRPTDRPNHDQADLLFLGEANQAIEFVGHRFDGHIHAVGSGAGVARRAEHRLGAWRARQFPDQGVFAAAFAQHQNVHPSLRNGRMAAN